MAKHDTLDADHDKQPVVTYVRVGRGMIKVAKYEKEDRATRETNEGSVHSVDSSRPHAAPSVKSGKKSSMPSWVPKFNKSKKGKKDSVSQSMRISSPIQNSVNDDSPHVTEKPQDTLAPPPQHQGMLTPPSSPMPAHPRPLRAAHSHGDLPTTNPNDMWASIAQLETELVARYGRGAVPQLEALRERMRNMHQDEQPQYEAEGQPVYQQIEWAEDPRDAGPSWQAHQRAPSTSRVRTRTETLPARTIPPVPPIPRIHSTRAFFDNLDLYRTDQPSPIQASSTSHSMDEPDEGDSDDAAAYLQALGLEPSTPKESEAKSKARHARSSYGNSGVRKPQPARSATLPAAYPDEQVNPPEALEQYRRHLPRSDYVTAQSVEALGLITDPSVSSRSASPMHTSSAPDSPATRSQFSRRDLPPRPPPPITSAPYAPANMSRTQASPRRPTRDSPIQNSPVSFSRVSPRPQQSPMSLTVPSPHALRSAASNPSMTGSQLALPLVRVRITCPPQRGTLRQLPAFVLLAASARASFAAATWAQMVTYCARNAGVSIARRGGGGVLRVSVEERMAELMTPGGGRGVGDEEVGFGLGYYVSVEMTLEGEADDHGNEGSVPIATLSIPLPTTLGEIAIVFRERKDIRKALS
ncbi:unnamed protein product [Rhizoctonia solani]|uniref:Uncharacterized protein n=1 Tax=Rhizoctonia solani TaxID=456999 RepID=A0A8H3EAD6_9AGAM|nr:unnamed protein product [Rhizoctonia solani]